MFLPYSILLAAALFAGHFQAVSFSNGAFVTAITVSDTQNQPRQLLIRYTKGLGWFAVLEVRRQVGGRRPIAGGIAIQACGQTIDREGLVGYSAINAETVGIGTELTAKEVELITRCGHARLSIGGIEAILDGNVSARLWAIKKKSER